MGKVSERKKEFEETFNKVFGSNISWSKLSLKDLEQLANILTNHNDKICDSICSNKCKPTKALARFVDEVIPPEEQGPVIKLVRKLFES